jgi:hypothetical protein
LQSDLPVRSVLVLIAASCPACLDLRGGSSLSELSNGRVKVTTSPPEQEGAGQSVHLTIGLPGEGEEACARIADDVQATLDGASMDVSSRGEWHSDPLALNHPPWCRFAAFKLEQLPSAPSGTSSRIEIADDSTTWTIEVGDLLTSDLTIAPPVQVGDSYQVDVEWASTAGSIHYIAGSELVPDDNVNASVGWSWWDEPASGPSTVTVTGNQIVLDAPTKIWGVYLKVERLGLADTCDGPAGCSLDLNARTTRTF